MKTKTFLPIVFAAIVILACTNDQLFETESDNSATLQKNWNQTELTTTLYNNLSILSHHHIDAEKLRDIALIKSVIKFRFTLGLNKNLELEIDIAGVDQNGTIVNSFTSILNTNDAFKNSINSLQYSSFKYTNLSNSSTHLLPYKTAYSYINKWQNAIQKKQVETLISYEGERIRYFSLPKEVVEEMTASKNVAAIALFFGLNTSEKLTTVLIQKSQNGSLLLKEENNYLGTINDGENPGEGEGNIYDFTEPCPNLCD